MKIFKIKKTNISKKIYFLGIPIYTSKSVDFVKNISIFGIKIKRHLELNKILSYIEDLKYNLPIQIQASVVHSYLQKYRNCNKDKDVVIIACGPTANYYDSIKDAKHLAINKAVVFNKINFDYSFLTDFYSTNDTNQIVDEYDNEKCEKFYCLIPERRFQEIAHLENCGQIPMSNYMNSNSNILLLEDVVAHKWARELSFEPLGDFEGTVFSALQFLLYTHPKRIYLVGCDETSGYFFDNKNHKITVNEYALNIWKKFKKFADYEYRDIEIISVNPVGLKGLFKDVYTKEYLNNHPEIDSNGVEILENK